MFIGKLTGKLSGVFKKVGSIVAGFYMLTSDNEVLVTDDDEILIFK